MRTNRNTRCSHAGRMLTLFFFFLRPSHVPTRRGLAFQDCGPWGEFNSNYTDTSFYGTSTSWFDDTDDWEILWNDDGLLYGQENNAVGVYKRDWNDHTVVHKV